LYNVVTELLPEPRTHLPALPARRWCGSRSRTHLSEYGAFEVLWAILSHPTHPGRTSLRAWILCGTTHPCGKDDVGRSDSL